MADSTPAAASGSTSQRPGARLLGEALVPGGAAGGAQALARADRNLPPRRLGDAGDQLVPVARVRVVGPAVDPLDGAAECGDRERVEQLLVGLRVPSSVQLVQAQVVPAALEDGER